MDFRKCILHILDVEEDLIPISKSGKTKWNTAEQWLDVDLDNAEKKISLTLEKKELFDDFVHGMIVSVIFDGQS